MPLTPGTKLGGRYEVLEPIGAGGMGEVWRARDLRLERSVAVKILPEHLVDDADALARLETEARALAALQHPNILTVHDLGAVDGTTYVVTELLEGETLRAKMNAAHGPLDWREAAAFAASVADALAGAHTHGIVHRDVKPENVFLTREGGVKVLDFGVARIVGGSVPVDELSRATTLAETKPGTLVGTIGYISPEQLRGLATDARSDLFALGCVLWEMLFGTRPFARDTVAETIAALLRDDPVAPAGTNVPPALVALVTKCLARDPEARPRTAAELASALRGGAETSALEVARSGRFRASRAASHLAVFPFAHEGEDAEYVADGMTEDLIDAFAKVPKLRVMARSTVFRYKGRSVDPLETGRRLGVKTVLTGRLKRSGDELGLLAELVDVKTGAQKWSGEYTSAVGELCGVTGKIVTEVGERLLPKREARPRRRLLARNAEAYDLMLKARWHWYRRPHGTPKAIELFEKALERDPRLAPAWTGLADCYMSLGGSGVGTLPPGAVMPKAKAAVTKALEIDPTLAEAHASLGHITMHFDWDFAKAEAALKEALRLNPRSAPAHHWMSHLATILGRVPESERETLEALALDPLDLSMNVHLAWHYYFAKDYDRAIREANRTLALDPVSFWPWQLLGCCYDMTGRHEEAVAAQERAVSLAPTLPVGLSALGHALAKVGRRADAEAVLEKLSEQARASYVPPHMPATVELALGRTDAALELLEKAYASRSDFVPYLAVEPLFLPLASDPRFCDIVERLGLR